MAIKVKFFAKLREELGRAEASVEYSEGLSVSQLWANLIEDRDIPEKVLVSINMEYVKGDPILNDGDEVAFFPPVTGG